MCDRWHKTPDEILNMSAESIRMLRIYQRGNPAREIDEIGGDLL